MVHCVLSPNYFSGSSMYVFRLMDHQCVLSPNYFSGSSMYVFRLMDHQCVLSPNYFSGSSMYVFRLMDHQCVLSPNYFSGSSMYVFRPLAHRVDLIGQRGIWGIGREAYAFTHETKVSNCCSTETLSAVSSRMASVCELTLGKLLHIFRTCSLIFSRFFPVILCNLFGILNWMIKNREDQWRSDFAYFGQACAISLSKTSYSQKRINIP